MFQLRAGKKALGRRPQGANLALGMRETVVKLGLAEVPLATLAVGPSYKSRT